MIESIEHDFFDIPEQLLGPFERTWKGRDVLEEKYIEANKKWCENLRALEWERYFPQEIARNNTYFIFSNMLYNYKTGNYFPPERGFFKPYHSEKNKIQKKDGEQVPIPVDLFSHLNLPTFSKTKYDSIVTKVYKPL